MKKILSVILMTVILMTAFLTVHASAQDSYAIKIDDDGITYYYNDFAKGWTDAVTLAKTGETVITIGRDWIAGDANSNGIIDGDETKGSFLYYRDNVECGTKKGSLLVTGKLNLTIDLNGHTISRGLADMREDGQVFTVSDGAKLTINNTSVNTNACITGGMNSGYGGGFNVSNRATLILNGGRISGNKANCGGGVYVCNALFYMNGGSVDSNYAEQGGGVALDRKTGADKEYIVCKGGKIHRNSAKTGGGIYASSNREDSVITFENTEISMNNATGSGGGVYTWLVDEDCEVTFGKGTVVKHNTADQGGGVYADSGSLRFIDAQVIENEALTRCGGVGVDDDLDDNAHGNIVEYGKLTFGGNTYIQGNYIRGGSYKPEIASNLHIGDETCDIYQDVNNPLIQGASIGIDMYADFGTEAKEEKLSDAEGNFAADSYKCFTADNPDYIITAIDDGSDGANKYQIYMEMAEAALDGGITGATLKPAFRSNEAAYVDAANKTLTFTVNPTMKRCLENISLSNLADYIYAADAVGIADGDKIIDLLETTDYYCQVMAKNDRYELWKIKILPYGGKWSEEDGSAARVTVDGTTKYYACFETAWADAIEASAQKDTLFVLNKDWVAGDADADGYIDPGKTGGIFKVKKNGSEIGTNKGRLYLDNSNYNFTIDLNGNDINRGLASATTDGQVFRLASGARLTINDSSEKGNGKITGGNNNGNGGAFYIDYGKLYINGGEISGNKANNGAAIYGTNHNDTFIYINGGKITGNTATQNGGGVYMYNGFLYVDGGEISGNTAQNGGGIYWESRDIFCLTGGKISQNTADEGAGVYATDWGDMYIGGTIEVKNNSFKTGGGVSNLYMKDDDVYLNHAVAQSEKVPNKPLTAGAYIGMYGEDRDYCVSDSDSRFDINSIKYLHADDSSCFVCAVYDQEGENHSYKIYYNDANNTEVQMPHIKTVKSASQVYLEELHFDYNNQSILIESDATIKRLGLLEDCPLSYILDITFEHEGTRIIGLDEKRDLTKPQEYVVMGKDGTYTFCTTSVKWVCQSHEDKDGNGICDLCEEYILTECTIVDYNADTKEAIVFITEPGRYTLIFAGYQNKKLVNVDVVEYDFKEGINIVSQINKTFAIGKGDKVMLWYDMIDLVPVCNALTLN